MTTRNHTRQRRPDAPHTESERYIVRRFRRLSESQRRAWLAELRTLEARHV